MKKALTILSTFLATSIISLMCITTPVSAAELSDAAQKGRDVAFDRKKGNCLACHVIAHGVRPAGNIGPPLLTMTQRFPNKADLRAQIWDATVKNSESLMPPFGRHEILTEKEIDQVVEFINTL